ncbi:hypothetical protein LguiB_013048 [Lonicera macranthoides]
MKESHLFGALTIPTCKAAKNDITLPSLFHLSSLGMQGEGEAKMLRSFLNVSELNSVDSFHAMIIIAFNLSPSMNGMNANV